MGGAEVCDEVGGRVQTNLCSDGVEVELGARQKLLYLSRQVVVAFLAKCRARLMEASLERALRQAERVRNR